MRVIAFIENELIARRILEHLGLTARPPPRGPRHPPGLEHLPIDRSDFDGVDSPFILTDFRAAAPRLVRGKIYPRPVPI
jgi:hypothetical protein